MSNASIKCTQDNLSKCLKNVFETECNQFYMCRGKKSLSLFIFEIYHPHIQKIEYFLKFPKRGTVWLPEARANMLRKVTYNEEKVLKENMVQQQNWSITKPQNPSDNHKRTGLCTSKQCRQATHVKHSGQLSKSKKEPRISPLAVDSFTHYMCISTLDLLCKSRETHASTKSKLVYISENITNAEIYFPSV